MKKLIEVENEGLISLMGEKVTLFCANYFYTGKLTGVNDNCVRLDNPSIVYDTGDWSKDEYSDVQALPCDHIYICTGFIEAFGVVK